LFHDQDTSGTDSDDARHSSGENDPEKLNRIIPTKDEPDLKKLVTRTSQRQQARRIKQIAALESDQKSAAREASAPSRPIAANEDREGHPSATGRKKEEFVSWARENLTRMRPSQLLREAQRHGYTHLEYRRLLEELHKSHLSRDNCIAYPSPTSLTMSAAALSSRADGWVVGGDASSTADESGWETCSSVDERASDGGEALPAAAVAAAGSGASGDQVVCEKCGVAYDRPANPDDAMADLADIEPFLCFESVADVPATP